MDIGPYAKAVVAVVMGLLLLIEAWTGWKSDVISEEWLLTIIAVLTPILVYFVPNRRASA
jgi:hypothetical protein